MKTFKWAIVGTGHIANCFAESFAYSSGGVCAAVVSREIERAKIFSKKYSIPSAYDNLSEMLDKEMPDIVYIATPNNTHFDLAKQALEAGVNLLCEKPFVETSARLQELLDMAKSKNLFVLEGLWTRFFPASIKAREWIGAGKIGKVLAVRAAFDVKPDVSKWQAWKLTKAASGGAMRDVGVYPLAFALMAFPRMPSKIFSELSFNGEVDVGAQMMFAYPQKETAFLSASFNMFGNHLGVIMGELGRIEVGPDFWHPKYAKFVDNDGRETLFDAPAQSHGFEFEITHVNECLAAKFKESPFFTWKESELLCELVEKILKEQKN